MTAMTASLALQIKLFVSLYLVYLSHAVIQEDAGGHRDMLVWHCSRMEYAETSLCLGHRLKFNGKPKSENVEEVKKLGPVNAKEFELAKAEWCEKEANMFNIFCAPKNRERNVPQQLPQQLPRQFPRSNDHFENIKSMVTSWCLDQEHSNSKLCRELPNLIASADEDNVANLQQLPHKHRRMPPGELEVIKQFTTQMREGDTDVHNLLDDWCSDEQHNESHICQKWRFHDHKADL